MKKSEATQALGKNEAEAARAIGITPQAYCQWPDELPQRLVDRVQAALYRKATPPPRRKPAKAG
jgi:hypothetical protein